MGYHEYKTCIDACLDCAAVCDHCASECLKEEDIESMRRCIQFDMECAALCRASAELMSLGSSKAQDICEICSALCNLCADECAQHNMEHCKECAAMCRRCAEECNSMAAA
jgi:hypothetical protein